MQNNVDWKKLLIEVAGSVSDGMNISICVENFILDEISERIEASLTNLHIERPNVAKIAGIVAFWVRKLKPFFYDPVETATGGKLTTLNEMIAVQSGLTICKTYKDDWSKENFHLSDRLLFDWLHSLRFHSHSPHSSLFAFELLTTDNEETTDNLFRS
ncbi:MAG: hypothetical protein LBR82_00735 [Desulfovibrio sp.]|jgi:hypothetical protein|nr:hypothetical protein [Desulfovibrio sp.]